MLPVLCWVIARRLSRKCMPRSTKPRPWRSWPRLAERVLDIPATFQLEEKQMIRFKCTQCRFHLRYHTANVVVRCPKCGQRVSVPGAARRGSYRYPEPEPVQVLDHTEPPPIRVEMVSPPSHSVPAQNVQAVIAAQHDPLSQLMAMAEYRPWRTLRVLWLSAFGLLTLTTAALIFLACRGTSSVATAIAPREEAWTNLQLVEYL